MFACNYIKYIRKEETRRGQAIRYDFLNYLCHGIGSLGTTWKCELFQVKVGDIIKLIVAIFLVKM